MYERPLAWEVGTSYIGDALNDTHALHAIVYIQSYRSTFEVQHSPHKPGRQRLCKVAISSFSMRWYNFLPLDKAITKYVFTT